MIAIYGDLIIDTYIYGSAKRLSPEAPVPVISFEYEETKKGGAGNVYENVKSLTNDVKLCTWSNNPPVKKRIFADKHYITRIDVEGNSTWEHSYVEQANIAIISDYAKGSFNTLDLSKLPRKTIVDPKGDLAKYKGMWCIKPNAKEFEPYRQTNDLKTDMLHARDILDIEHLIVTLGSDGVAYCSKKSWFHLEANKVEVFDVTGAGDTFTAVLAYCIDKGDDFETAIRIANTAASVAVKHQGTYIIQKHDIEKPLVFTNGCFDILHPGHLHLLNEAKKLGNVIIGLNSDNSVKRIKGSSRPINKETTRKLMLELMGYTVVIFDEDTPENLIKAIKPDIIVKGSDYKKEDVVGNDVAKVHLVNYIEGVSTTGIVRRINNGKE